MKLCMFQTVQLSIIRSLFTVHLAMVYVYKPVWHITLLSVQWINSWWWTDELSETYRVSCQNEFVKLVHLVGFIINKFVTMHGHMNVKKKLNFLPCFHDSSSFSVTADTCSWLGVSNNTRIMLSSLALLHLQNAEPTIRGSFKEKWYRF